MTKGIRFFLLTGLVILTITACNRDIENLPQQPPGSTDTSSFLQLSVNGVQLTGNQLYALISIENKAGQPVFSNKKFTLDYIQGIYKTDKIKLNKGEFRISKFIVLNAADTAIYATPVANTTKAGEVTNPLSFPVVLNQYGINMASIQVVRVILSDSPANFGYTISDFGFQPTIDVKIKLKINVGTVIYDSLPGRLMIDATNNAGEHWIREIEINRGITAIRIPDDYSNYKFEINKWNVVAQRQYNRMEIQAGMVVQLDAARQPRRLVEERIYIENSAGLIPDSRNEYYYNGAGKLSEIKNYQKSLQVSGLPLTFVYKFRYRGQELDSINRFAANNSSTGFTAFTYAGGKISNMHNKSYDQQTGAAVEYSTSGNNEVIEVDYLFSNGNSMNYKIFTRNGNRISDQAQSSTGGREGGSYEYDDNINPKHQLGYHDLFFTNYSKNNLTREQKGYAGAIPQAVPYKFEYTYNTDGYPSEAYVSYKGFSSQQHLYRIKRVYIYQ
jgi:hypothetical protein